MMRQGWIWASLVLGLSVAGVAQAAEKDLFETAFMQQCHKKQMFKEVSDLLTGVQAQFDETKACRCVARKILADSRV